MLWANRRSDYRIPFSFFLNEHHFNRSSRCLSINLGTQGIFLNRLKLPALHKNPKIGLEFELPGTAETIWAKGEICYHLFDRYFHGTGIKFTGMAQKHERLIRDYVVEKRKKVLEDLLIKVHNNRFVSNLC